MLSIRQAKPTVLTVLILLFLSGSTPSLQAEHIPIDSSVFEVTFHQSQGVKFDQHVNLSGTSSIPMRNTTWAIVNISGVTPITVLSGPFLTSVVPVAEGEYAWTLMVDLGSVSCTCYVQLRVEDAQHVEQQASLVVYVGSMNHRPVLLDELVMFSQGAVGDSSPIIMKESVNVEFGLATANNDPNGLQVFSNVCEAPYEVCLTTPRRVNVPFQPSENGLLLKLNRSVLGIDEGIWRVDFWAVDAALRSSGVVRIHLLYDNTPPIANLTSVASGLEREAVHVYAQVEDGYEGATASLTWVIGFENGSTRAPNTYEFQSARQLVLLLNHSGIYTIELTALDRAGNAAKMSHTLRIENLKPIARVTVDGMLVTSDYQVKLGPEQNWTINGSESSDNEAVEYLWVIDDTFSIRGVSALTRADFTSPGSHTVELIVFDDDGATDSSMINVNILEEGTLSSRTPQTSVLGGAIVLIILAIGFVMYFKSESAGESELPKWHVQPPQPTRINSENYPDLDATVEEDKPRG
jgi:hypothetical protein